MSEQAKTWTKWLNKTRFSASTAIEKNQTLILLQKIANKILDRANLKPDDIILDVGTGTGMLAFSVYERLQDSVKIIASDAFEDCLEECKKTAKNYGIENKITFLQSDAADIKLPDNSVDVIVIRSVLVHIIDKVKPINEFFRVLKSGGKISCYESIMNQNTKFYDIINPDSFKNYEKLKEVENKILSNKNDSLLNFNEDSLRKDLEEAGFKNIEIIPAEEFSQGQLLKEEIDVFFNTTLSVGQPTLKEKYLQYLSEEEVNNFIEILKTEVSKKEVVLNLPKAYIYAEKE